MASRFVQVNGLRMHILEEGEGPLVVLLHGFPEIGASWRHQIRALAAAGYRVIAPDQRGYGQTDCPEREDAYSMLHLVGDVIALLDAAGAADAVVVGHDWGAPVAWQTALLRPDRVRAVGGLSVPPRPRANVRTTDALRRLGSGFYQTYFQAPGVAERDLERDVRGGLRRLLYAASGDAPPEQRWTMQVRGTFFEGLADPADLPAWLDDAHLDALVTAFERTGFRGGLSWYRNMDRNWEQSAAFDGLVIRPPALFMVGDADPLYALAGAAIEALPQMLPALWRSIVLPGCGHWIGEERPGEVTAALLAWLAACS